MGSQVAVVPFETPRSTPPPHVLFTDNRNPTITVLARWIAPREGVGAHEDMGGYERRVDQREDGRCRVRAGRWVRVQGEICVRVQVLEAAA